MQLSGREEGEKESEEKRERATRISLYVAASFCPNSSLIKERERQMAASSLPSSLYSIDPMP